LIPGFKFTTQSLLKRLYLISGLRCANGAAGDAAACLTALVVDFTVARATNSGNETVRVVAQLPMDNQQ